MSALILNVPEVVTKILLCLDTDTIDDFIISIQINSTFNSYLNDATLWNAQLVFHFGGSIPNIDPNVPYHQGNRRIKERGWDWNDPKRTCYALREFLQTKDDCEFFNERVHVIKGNIGTIKSIGDVSIDGIAFPTNPHLSNHRIGAAAAIFARAGLELRDFVMDPAFRGRREYGTAAVTPGFQGGVHRLIHCVGPPLSHTSCSKLLLQTYENMTAAIQREELKCVAVASIATGSMGVPGTIGAQLGLKAIQEFIRATDWDGHIGIVCVEQSIYNCFYRRKNEILRSFNNVSEFLHRPLWRD